MKQCLLYSVIGGLLSGAVYLHTATAEEPDMAYLMVSVSGLGSIVSDPPGISCPGTCEAEFPPFSDVELHAKPDKGQHRMAWAGDCDSPTNNCRLYMDSDKIVQVSFSIDL